FITHIYKTPLFNKSKICLSGMKYDFNCDNIQLVFYGIFEVKKLTKSRKTILECEKYIPELAKEKILYEKLQLIYININKIKNRILKKKCEELIETYGIHTESPSKLAQELLALIKKYRKIKKL
ncbi:hypothetical protein ACFL3T_03420, partial [Patescibacteria group bacterium]